MIFQLSAFHKINFLRMEVDPKKNDQVRSPLPSAVPVYMEW